MAEVGMATEAMAARDPEAVETKARALLLHLFWLLPCLAVFIWFFASEYHGLRLMEAMDAAQIGRNVSEGKGFTTDFLRPLGIAQSQAQASRAIVSAPLYPLTLAVAFNLLQPDDRTVALVATLFGFVAAVLAYLLGLRLAGRAAGGVAALLVSLHTGLLSAGVEGVSLTLTALLVTLLLYLIVQHRGTPRWSMLCGAVCGLLYLSEYAALPLLIPAAVLVAKRPRAARRRHVALFLAGFALLALPWLLRDWRVSGGPVASMRARSVAASTEAFPGYALFRSLDAAAGAPLAFVKQHPREVVKKVALNLGTAEARIAELLDLCPLLVFCLALLVDLRQAAANRLKWALLASSGLLVANLCLGLPRYEVLYILVGGMTAVGAAALVTALRPSGRRALTLAAGSLVLLSTYPVVLTCWSAASPPAPSRKNAEYLRQAVPPGAVVVTDEPWVVAWYADREAVWFPQESVPSPEEQQRNDAPATADVTRQRPFEALAKAGVRADAIFLSSQLDRYPAQEGAARWQMLRGLLAQELDALQQGRIQGTPWAPPGWTLAATLPPNEFLLLRSALLDPGRS